MLEINELYLVNDNFKSYVDKYCVKHNKSVEEALKHKVVQEYSKFYELPNKDEEKR